MQGAGAGDGGGGRSKEFTLTLTKLRNGLRKRSYPGGDGRSVALAEEQPLRAELFSVDQLEQHAKALAGWHELTEQRGAEGLLPRLDENQAVLLHAYELVSEAAARGERIAPAGEWLLDNFYLIEEQIRTARRHLPRGYSRELPRLANGPSAGYPRVYDIALELISHVDGRIDAGSLNSFVSSYQALSTLKLGEVWAVPIMLRLALIENLRRVAVRIAAGRRERDIANLWADRLSDTGEKEPGNVVLVLADMVRARPPLSSAFVAEFCRRLQSRTPALGFPMTWLEQRLAETGQTVQRLVQEESQRQAADQVSIGNSIGSLRFLSAMDWRQFVESISAVEHMLRSDPPGVYGRMDFATRDRYRHAVEAIARRSAFTEEEVAGKAIQLAWDRCAREGEQGRSAHVGYFLVSHGRRQLEKAVGMHRPLALRLQRLARRFPLAIYLGVVLAASVAATAGVLGWGRALGLGAWGAALLALPALLCASQLAVAIVNWLSSLLVAPRTLPRMDFAEGIPPEFRTVVAVPTMLGSAEAVDELLEALEVRYLANRDANLHFALLSDFRDASQEMLAEDDELLTRAVEGIEALARKYADQRQDIFFLFHRPRRWNAQEGVWMGWERKRGKLTEFNSFLRGGAGDRFSVIVGPADVLAKVKYVITLDTDTQLPRDTARELVGTMAHPLNRPLFDPQRGRVVDGYSILQPRVGVSLPGAARSRFAQVFAGDAGVDPYTRAVSDLYQDVFQEGSYIGKGIYDVDAFEQSLRGRFPENRILSHDLLEGSHARAGLVSDIMLVEEYPSRYPADVSRRHRWMRGDWQITPWLMPLVPSAAGPRMRNAVSMLSRWKIFDNLRRSLVPIGMLALLLAGWFVPGSPLFYTLVVAAVILLPPLFAELQQLVRKSVDVAWRPHLRSVGASMLRHLAQSAVALASLPYDALVSADAILRTSGRVLFTRKRLLEWQTSTDAERNARSELSGFYVSMAVNPLTAAVALGLAIIFRQRAIPEAAVIGALWMAAPAVAWWLSRPLQSRRAQLTADDVLTLRKLGRRTWRFFEMFVVAAENHLPPDNFQEHPAEVVAHRTSPTNIGMALLANLAAYDFGYISAGVMIDRLTRTLGSVEKLQRYRGHLYNWYDTRTLEPLTPRYVSSVDSGNLAGHALVLAAGLEQLEEAPVLPAHAFRGLADCVAVVADVARGEAVVPGVQRRAIALPEPLVRLERMQSELNAPPRTLAAAVSLLQRVRRAAGDLAGVMGGVADEELKWWVHALEQQSRDALEDVARLAPWVHLPAAAEPLWRRGTPEQVKRLGELRELLRRLDEVPSLREVARLDTTLLPQIDRVSLDQLEEPAAPREESNWMTILRREILAASQRATQRLEQLTRLASRSRELAELSWDFLYDASRHLLAIGYNVADHRRDDSYYDLLASEARLASYVAIAQGKLPQEHWFALGRLLTTSGSQTALLSWSGSMFEYLMPTLVMPAFPGTLLDQTCRAVIRRQVEYGQQRNVPWGISESGYNTTDVHLNYQYRAFGVPGLGFKRGLGEDVVIAPYATVMSLMVSPEAAVANLRRLIATGAWGSCGMYEAIDYTPARLPRGTDHVIVRSFMAHHQGMSLLSLLYLLNDRPMQRRFESDPMLKSAELLLQERVPRAAPIYPHAAETADSRKAPSEAEGIVRVFPTPDTPTPEVHLLSNGRYNVMISAAGGGYSRWKDLAVTRWVEDGTRDASGQFCYIRDTESNIFWSSAHQPTHRRGENYEAIFSQARAEFRRLDHEIDTHTEISVSPEDDIELRRLTLTNRSRSTRTIDVSTYAEVVMAAPAADAAHPAFSNLFVQTEILRQRQAIVCTRRPRSAAERPPWMFHLMTVSGTTVGEAGYETDRARFIGRGRSLADPAAMYEPALSDTDGSVLDPIVSIRRTITLLPDESAKIDMVTGMAETREAVLAMVEKYHDRRLADRVFEMAWTHSQVVLRQLDATEADAQLFARLAGSILYPSAGRRAAASVIARNRRGQSGLWSYGISGDLPIILLRVGDQNRLELVKHMVQAHAYWRMKGLSVDLLIWNEDQSGYRQLLQDRIMGLIAAGTEAHLLDKPGGIFVRRIETISEEDKVLMQTVARVIVADTAGTLLEQVDQRTRSEVPVPRFTPTRQRRREEPQPVREITRRDLVLFNGIGGFTADGREYVVTTTPDALTPAPWSNVIASPHIGTVVTESGAAYTWVENAHEFRLTPWYNDPVRDISGEAFYIRDEETGRVWSPSPWPVRGPMPYATRHGFGYTVFEYRDSHVSSEMWSYVAMDAPVKFCVIKLRNNSSRPRRLSVTGFIEWVLGEHRPRNMMHVVTEIDPKSGALLAHNAYNGDFPDRVAFFDISDSHRTVTGDRTEFIGRNGSFSRPAAMGRTRLSGRTGAGLDPCAAMQTVIDLAEGQEREIAFMFGAGRDIDEARALVERFRGVGNARRALESVWNYWNRTLGTVYVETPDPSINFLVNGWLPYQVLSCRYWGRSGFYQSGGAYGFRDQLQDMMAMLHAEPRLLREHLLRSAAHQFREGDVQHWWHPPTNRGVRTRISDDYLWLPLAVCRYVGGTGDTGVLDERINFIEGRPVKSDEESYYDLPARSEESATLYEHCVRAINNGLNFGPHGLPLMSCGDWNDGMNLVGEAGKGESVWLAFFLHEVLRQFAQIARMRGDRAFADTCTGQAEKLRKSIEAHAWDGEWYRRAYFDNGEPLGSSTNPECQIDAIPQSWAVLSGAGEKTRARTAMTSMQRRLVDDELGLIRLFEPAFDKSHLDPGYIKGYVPGVRENGGQYTHAAVWTVMAVAAMGDAPRAWHLLSLINPVNHASNRTAVETYKVEPYVVAADVYTNPQHAGRGGWTWYTGSAAWMYRLITESLLGLHVEVDRLRLKPLLPATWKSFRLHYRYRETFHHILVHNGGSGTVLRVVFDGVERPDKTIPLVDDRKEHHAEIFLS